MSVCFKYLVAIFLVLVIHGIFVAKGNQLCSLDTYLYYQFNNDTRNF